MTFSMLSMGKQLCQLHLPREFASPSTVVPSPGLQLQPLLFSHLLSPSPIIHCLHCSHILLQLFDLYLPAVVYSAPSRVRSQLFGSAPVHSPSPPAPSASRSFFLPPPASPPAQRLTSICILLGPVCTVVVLSLDHLPPFPPLLTLHVKDKSLTCVSLPDPTRLCGFQQRYENRWRVEQKRHQCPGLPSPGTMKSTSLGCTWAREVCQRARSDRSGPSLHSQGAGVLAAAVHVINWELLALPPP